ncbi:SDR family NAD(P)-dependent oxidoreductase [Ilumatobacter sp.]|uniref:SDR family NAD(P)-dependent oxidoreductase n=1 Tax=Ilumatobacter sp. TaxID=1967498 RepID=UPI003B51EFC6
MAARDLDGAVVAVVGATGGLGSALVESLTEAGATVVGANRSGGTDVRLDLRDAGAGDALVAHVREAHGRLDGVVVAAGIVAFGEVTDTDDIVVEELMLTNAMGPLWLARRVEPLLAESEGFLVNVSGVVAETPMPSMVAYSASKSAASGALRALAKEWRRRRIAVVDVRPPHTETALSSHPLAGTAPQLGEGLAPRAVADRIVRAVVDGERELSGADFGDGQGAAQDPT